MRLAWVSVAFVAALAGACAGAPGNPAASAKQGVNLRQIYASMDCGAGIGERRATRLTDERSYSEFWTRANAGLLNKSDPPPVDFTGRHIVVVEMGQKPTAGFALSLRSTVGQLRDGVLLIPIHEVHPRGDALTAQVTTSPCLLVEIDAGNGDFELIVSQ